MKTFSDSAIRWVPALSLAALQIGVAVFAVYSSRQDILSDGACLGGIFGTLVNLAILAVVLIWALVVAVRSFRAASWHTSLKPLAAVVLSSTLAIFIGMEAGLRCTV